MDIEKLYMNEYSTFISTTLQSDLTSLDVEIDALVCALYRLTEEEIRIVEGGEE